MTSALIVYPVLYCEYFNKVSANSMLVPEGIKVSVEGNTKIAVTGADKELIGMFAAEIRSKRPPEPFKGKGVKYAEEYIVRKEGKKK